jgi:general secretion pathway protein A
MYKTFYNLHRNPFEITPDPRFLFPTTRHNEALASLYYGVRSNRGFVVLTGEVGTGKTLILRSLLGLLQQRDVAFALIFNPTLSPIEFIRYIARDFGLQVADKPKDELIHLLNGFLLQRHEKRLTTILVVDEAHHLSMEILEEVRLLTNLETSQQKLLQIVLAGQPELDSKLDSYELRQLKQRVALRCHLEPLTLAETVAYVNQRLKIAGAIGPNQIFTTPAIEAVFGHSQGIPRIINTICENALLAGYAKHAATITSETIDDVARDLRLGVEVVHPRHNEFDVSMEEQHREVLQAVKTLLDMRDRVRQTDPKRRVQ